MTETEFIFETDLSELTKAIFAQVKKRPSRIVRDSTSIRIFFNCEVKEEDVQKIEDVIVQKYPLMKLGNKRALEKAVIK